MLSIFSNNNLLFKVITKKWQTTESDFFKNPFLNLFAPMQ